MIVANVKVNARQKDNSFNVPFTLYNSSSIIKTSTIKTSVRKTLINKIIKFRYGLFKKLFLMSKLAATVIWRVYLVILKFIIRKYCKKKTLYLCNI